MSNTNFGNFSAYKQTVMGLSSDLNTLQNFSSKLKLMENSNLLENAIQKLKEEQFDIAIVGEFKRGKSTLINALLGKDVLPTDVLPATATLNKITYDLEKYVHVKFKDGREENVDINDLNTYVTKLDDKSSEMSKTVSEAIVHYPVEFCKNNVNIIDTPGLNDDQFMTDVTMSIIPQIDAAIMVVMAQSPFSEYERDFLTNKIMASDLGRVLFAVTGIDLLDEEDVDRVLNSIKKRIETNVMLKAEKTYGADSQEYAAYKQKIGKVRVFGLSAKQALKAKLKGDDALLQRSCFTEFEKALETFLTEDRGAIILSVPNSRLINSSFEIVKAIELRKNALKMQDDEFEAKYEKANIEIENIRIKRKKECLEITNSSDKAYKDLSPILNNYWSKIEAEIFDIIEQYPLSNDDISKDRADETKDNILKEVTNSMKKTSQVLLEQIQDKINVSLMNEAERLNEFEKYFFTSTETIQNLFIDVKQSGNSTNTDVIITTLASSYFGYGLGGIYLGFKEAGFKGALLGGASSAAGFVGTSFALGALVTTLSIPVTWPVLLVGIVSSSIISTLTGKKVLEKVFSKDKKVEKYKEAFKETLTKQISEMKNEGNFEKAVKDQINTAFDSLKKKLEKETESILTDTQNQLMELKIQRTQAITMSENETATLDEMIKEIDEICVRAQTLSSKLAVIIERK